MDRYDPRKPAGPDNLNPDWPQYYKDYYVWLRTADAHSLWDGIHRWQQFDGQDSLQELVQEMRKRGYNVDLSIRGWHVYKTDIRQPLDDEFKPRL